MLVAPTPFRHGNEEMLMPGVRFGNSRTSRRAVRLAIRGRTVSMAAGPVLAMPVMHQGKYSYSQSIALSRLDASTSPFVNAAARAL